MLLSNAIKFATNLYKQLKSQRCAYGPLYSFLFYFRLTFVSFLFVWIRGTIPRFRYDKLMYLAWRRFLPLSLNYLLFFGGVRCSIFSLL